MWLLHIQNKYVISLLRLIPALTWRGYGKCIFEAYEFTNTRVPNIRARLPRANNILANSHHISPKHPTVQIPTQHCRPLFWSKYSKVWSSSRLGTEPPGTRGLLPSIFGTKPIRFNDRCKWVGSNLDSCVNTSTRQLVWGTVLYFYRPYEYSLHVDVPHAVLCTVHITSAGPK